LIARPHFLPVRAWAGALVALAMWFGLVFVAMIVFVFWHPPLVTLIKRRAFVDLDQLFTHGSLVRLLLLPWAALAITFVGITIHEVGHVLGGMLVGFRFNSLRVSRIQIDRPFRLSLYRGKNAGSGGWASMFPVKLDHLVLRATAMILAGPAVNFLTVGVMLLLPPVGPLSAYFLLVSLFLGIMNLLPFRSGAYHSDGSRILMLLSNRARGERWVAMLKLSAELRESVMPESLAPAYLAKAIALRDKSMDTVVAHSLAYSAAFHLHKDAEAAEMLEVCLQYANYASPLVRISLMSDAAVFQACRRRNIDLARQWLAVIPESREIPWLRHRAEAAILEAQGDIPASLKKLDEAEQLIRATPNEARREISLRFLQRWQSELRAQLLLA